MDIKQIKELMTAMGRAGMDKLIWKKGDVEIQLERHPEAHPQTVTHYSGHPATFMSQPTFEQDFQRPLPAARGVETTAPVTDEVGAFITSPMVGTYYTSPSPEDPSFIKVGDKVDPNTVVCIIEAMKVMNEVKAGISGTVAEILVSNASPVEFGSKLVRVV